MSSQEESQSKPAAALTDEQEAAVRRLVEEALREDLSDVGDLTTRATIPENATARGRFLAKATGVVAGLRVAELVFEAVDKSLVVDWSVADGDRVDKGQYFGTVRGPASSIVTAERLALNLMQRMSGIATQTRAMVDRVGDKNKARILDTRKTAPMLRVIDKIAVVIGGGENHRFGLFDMLMIKDNHVTAAGGIVPATEKARAHLKSIGKLGEIPIEVETRTLAEVEQVLSLDAGVVDRIMLDNMVTVRDAGVENSDSSNSSAVVDESKTDENCKQQLQSKQRNVAIDTSVLEAAVKLVNGRIPTEASGNVTVDTVAAIAATGVDYISSGALTHSVTALDISLKITN